MPIESLQISRRKLLISVASMTTAGVVSAFPAALLASSHEIQSTQDIGGEFDIRYIVTDRRYPQSLAFAERLSGTAGGVLEITEGLTRMWEERLEPLWQTGEGGAVAGMTTRSAWECLAEQARSHALRTRILTTLAKNDGRPDNLAAWIIA